MTRPHHCGSVSVGRCSSGIRSMKNSNSCPALTQQSKVTSHKVTKSQVTSHKSQVTSHKSRQVKTSQVWHSLHIKVWTRASEQHPA
eukprot:3320412-Rhodomonas_salina.1